MTTLLITLTSVFGAIIWVRLPIITWIMLWTNKTSLKPLDCSFCMAGWSALIMSLIMTGEVVYSLCMCFTIPFVTAFTEYFYEKISK